MKLVTDICVCVWAMNYAAQHGRWPFVDELPWKGQVALGKKVFEYLDYRDEHRPDIPDDIVYEGCLNDHGIQRSFADGVDLAQARAMRRNWKDAVDRVLIAERFDTRKWPRNPRHGVNVPPAISDQGSEATRSLTEQPCAGESQQPNTEETQ